MDSTGYNGRDEPSRYNFKNWASIWVISFKQVIDWI
jgi:hypothetical protein